MIASLLLALAPSTAGAEGARVFEVPPRELGWGALEPLVFDRRWTLPERRREGRDLLAEMRRLAALRIELVTGETWTFGDLVAAARQHEGEARAEWLAGLAERAPRATADWGAGWSELLLDDHLRSDRWRPSRDHARDGILVAEGWELDRSYGAPWGSLAVTPRFEQAAVLLEADLATLKAVENDYRTYPENVGADYESIYPVDGEHFRGLDPAGRPFSAVGIRFSCDLPFPYSGYDCRLRILNRVAADGTLRTDIYSVSPDFHYLAGRDVFLPVEDSAGERVAWLVVRHFGFDIDDVPDRPKHRMEALRSSLGNLKRKAEARYRSSGPAPGPAGLEALTHFRVLGTR